MMRSSIYIDVLYEKPQPKASELARRYNLTYKTVYNFKKKVIMNNEFIDLDVYLKKNRINKEERMMKFYNKIKNL